MKKLSAEHLAKQLAECRELLEKSNRQVYTILRKVSASGMSRQIDVYVIIDNKPRWITPYVRDLCGYKQDPNSRALRVGGCGMDMGYSLVHELGSVVYKNGDGVTVTGRNGGKIPESDGGYLLTHHWI
jgi:hypothetical protein